MPRVKPQSTGLDGLMAPPVTDNILVEQARSAVRAPVLLPQHQSFENTLNQYGGALDQYSATLDAGIKHLQNERLHPEMLSPDEMIEIEGDRPPPPPKKAPEKSRAPKERAKPPARPQIKEALRMNPGQLLSQLLTMQEATPPAPTPTSMPGELLAQLFSENPPAASEPTLQALLAPTAPTPAPAPTPPPPAPTPRLVQEPPSPQRQLTEITDVAVPDAAPSSRFVLVRRPDGKLIGMQTPNGDFDLERDSQGRISAINMRNKQS